MATTFPASAGQVEGAGRVYLAGLGLSLPLPTALAMGDVCEAATFGFSAFGFLFSFLGLCSRLAMMQLLRESGFWAPSDLVHEQSTRTAVVLQLTDAANTDIVPTVKRAAGTLFTLH
jgi:hypothetical protein